jgi:hypothetical protein
MRGSGKKRGYDGPIKKEEGKDGGGGGGVNNKNSE